MNWIKYTNPISDVGGKSMEMWVKSQSNSESWTQQKYEDKEDRNGCFGFYLVVSNPDIKF